MNERKKIPKQLKALLDKAYKNFENTEQVSAPSGEWAEYNIDFITREAYLEGVQDAVNAVKQSYKND
jgi:hypothetical protein